MLQEPNEVSNDKNETANHLQIYKRLKPISNEIASFLWIPDSNKIYIILRFLWVQCKSLDLESFRFSDLPEPFSKLYGMFLSRDQSQLCLLRSTKKDIHHSRRETRAKEITIWIVHRKKFKMSQKIDIPFKILPFLLFSSNECKGGYVLSPQKGLHYVDFDTGKFTKILPQVFKNSDENTLSICPKQSIMYGKISKFTAGSLRLKNPLKLQIFKNLSFLSDIYNITLSKNVLFNGLGNGETLMTSAKTRKVMKVTKLKDTGDILILKKTKGMLIGGSRRGTFFAIRDKYPFSLVFCESFGSRIRDLCITDKYIIVAHNKYTFFNVYHKPRNGKTYYIEDLVCQTTQNQKNDQKDNKQNIEKIEDNNGSLVKKQEDGCYIF